MEKGVLRNAADAHGDAIHQFSGSALFSLQSAIIDEILSSTSIREKLKVFATLLQNAFEFDAVVFLAGTEANDGRVLFKSTDKRITHDQAQRFVKALQAKRRNGLCDVGSEHNFGDERYAYACYQLTDGAKELNSESAVLIGLLREGRKPSEFEEAAFYAMWPSIRLFTRTILAGHNLASEADSFDSLANSIPGVVYQRRVFPDGYICYTYISESAKEFFGISAEEIVNNPGSLFSSYAPEYAESFRERLIEASKKLEKWDVEASIIMPDGTRKFTHAIATPKRLIDGSVLWTGVILDASRIKEAEMEAAAAEHRTRSDIVESLAQGFVMFDSDGRIKIHNAQFETYFPQLVNQVNCGVGYTDLVRAELALRGPCFSSERNDDDIFAERLRAHEKGRPFSIEHKIDKATWVQVDEHRTNDGDTVIVYTDVSEIKNREARIHHMAMHDALTGLPNRTLFRDRIQQAVEASSRRKCVSAILCLDLDNFKNVNDTLGHPAGDQLLGLVAKRLKKIVRDCDTVARLGGDEFAIILLDIAGENDARILAERLIELLSKPFNLRGNQVVIGTSIGISFCNDGTTDPDELMRNSDLALYRAKFDGKNTYCFFENTMDELAQARRLLESDLRVALDESYLELHFQPQIDVERKCICGFEALVRWHHPERGTVSPAEFISIAEETGLIRELGDWVLINACRRATKWSKPVKVAVNLSPAQFKRPNLVEHIAEVLDQTGLDPSRLELEVTERLLLHNTQEVLDKMFRLKGLGVRVAMDDFGTGFSSLSNLRSFPFDRIKIDRSFVQEIGKNSDSSAIVKAIIGLGNNLGIATTAEGVETTDQLNYLKNEGCSEIQGFYYSHARPTEQVENLLEGNLETFRTLGLVELLGEEANLESLIE